MYITKKDSKREDWNQVKSWNYKLLHLKPKMSVVYAEVIGKHDEIETRESEWVYYIIDGKGEFIIGGSTTKVETGDVITIPAKTKYNYKSLDEEPLKVVAFIDFWDN